MELPECQRNPLSVFILSLKLRMWLTFSKGYKEKKIEEEYTVEYTCNPAKLAAIVFLVPCSKNLSTPVVEYLGERL